MRAHPRSIGPALVVLASVMGLPASAQGADAGVLVLTHATLVDGTGAPVRPDVSIVVRGDTIAEIVDGAPAAGLAGAMVVDLGGRWVVPGFIDGHLHLSHHPDLPAALGELLDAGITSVREMSGDARVLALAARDQRLGTLRGPRLYYSATLFGPPFLVDPRALGAARDLEPGTAPWARAVTAETDLRQAVTEARAFGVTGLKLYSALAPELVARIVAEGHRQGLQVWSHATIYPSRPSDAVRAGVDALSHSHGLFPEAGGELPGGFNEAISRWLPEQDLAAADPHASPYSELFALMAERGTVLEPTVSVPGGRPRSPAPADDEPRKEHLRRAAARIDVEALRRFACEATRAAHRAGVAISAGTDSTGGVHLPEQLEALVECGLSPGEALTAATLHNARVLGLGASHGSIEPGKVADLVVLSEDPLADAGHVRSVWMVVQGGRVVVGETTPVAAGSPR